MSISGNLPLVSICIPAYNGYPYISFLINELLTSPRLDFEVVVSDDCSKDQTWDYLQSLSSKDSRLKCFRNPKNLGMDMNFAHSASLATGQYVWLCGQDDMIFHEGIDAVIERLLVEPGIDFIYLNHTKIREEDSDPTRIEPVICSEHVDGTGLVDFLRHTKSLLPSFLPIYIIRKVLWDSVDVRRYFGTCYPQVGVFLESSPRMRWCHLDGNFVVGLLPKKGWQLSPLDYAKINIGYYLMLSRAWQHCELIDREMISLQYHNHLRQLIYSIILLRSYNLVINQSMLNELVSAIRPFFLVSKLAALFLRVPKVFCDLALRIILTRRHLRRLFVMAV
jgi:glycosyltransferase involved in cell wall biosynthesis